MMSALRGDCHEHPGDQVTWKEVKEGAHLQKLV